MNVSYTSLSDEDANSMIGPVPSGVVRAVSPLTRWVFRASPDRVGATDISVESLYIIFLLNMMMIVDSNHEVWNALKFFLF